MGRQAGGMGRTLDGRLGREGVCRLPIDNAKSACLREEVLSKAKTHLPPRRTHRRVQRASPTQIYALAERGSARITSAPCPPPRTRAAFSPRMRQGGTRIALARVMRAAARATRKVRRPALRCVRVVRMTRDRAGPSPYFHVCQASQITMKGGSDGRTRAPYHYPSPSSAHVGPARRFAVAFSPWPRSPTRNLLSPRPNRPCAGSAAASRSSALPSRAHSVTTDRRKRRSEVSVRRPPGCSELRGAWRRWHHASASLLRPMTAPMTLRH